MTRILFILLSICLLFLQACSDNGSLDPVPENGVILAFGDSLTTGVGASPENNYPAVLMELSGRKVIEAGVSGEQTAEGLVRLTKILSQVNPDLLILLEGGNDILRNKSSQHIKQNLAAMIELAQSNGVQVVLIGVPEKRLFSRVAPLYEELAKQYSLTFADDLLADLLRDNKYKSDAVHLNSQGYRVMAESIYQLLVKHGAF